MVMQKVVDFLNDQKEYYFNVYKAAPANLNSIEIAFQALHRKNERGEEVFVGCFLPELYVLAKNKAAPFQGPSDKTPFELAMYYPQHDPSSVKGYAEIGAYVAEIYKTRRDAGLAYPAAISKLRIRDYINNDIKEVKDSGLVIRKDFPPIGLKSNIPQPDDKAWLQHKLLQYAFSWIAPVLTFVAVVSVTAPTFLCFWH